MPKATRDIVPLSPYHNLPAGDLVDRLGALKAEIGGLQDQEKALREELIRRGSPSIEGAAYSAAITEAVRWTLDTASRHRYRSRASSRLRTKGMRNERAPQAPSDRKLVVRLRSLDEITLECQAVVLER